MQHFSLVQKSPINLEDIANVKVEEFLGTGYRQDAPVILKCHVPSLRHTSVIFFSPLNYYFCAIKEYSLFFNTLYNYTAHELVRNDNFYKKLIGEMKNAGIKKDDFPGSLFVPYSQYGAYGESAKCGALGKNFASFVGQKRIHSTFVPDSMADSVIDHWKHQLEQFGENAFYPAAETLNQVVGSPRFSESSAESREPYESPDQAALTGHIFLDARSEEEVTTRLLQIETLLSQGEKNVIKLFPLHVVKIHPSSHIRGTAPYPGHSWERALLRSRIVSLLGWPWHYFSVSYDLNTLIEKKLKFGDGRDEVVGAIISNLTKYLKNMEQKYPVILENPLEGLKIL